MALNLSLIVLGLEEPGRAHQPFPCHGRAYPLPVGTRLELGRNQNVDVVLPSNAINRWHAEVYRDEAGVWCRDLGSRNGTRVNRRALLPRKAYPLRPGDDLWLAAARLRLVEFDPSGLAWGGEALTRLAHALQAEARPQDLPVLADALEEAGCRDETILGHLREAGPHERGCWVLHLLTGRA